MQAAAAVAVLTALGNLDHGPTPPPAPVVPPEAARGLDGLPALCGPGTLPEGPVCIRIPGLGKDDTLLRAPALGRAGRTEETIPRRPDRPADPARYRYPLDPSNHAPRVMGGLDAREGDRPGIRLAATPSEPVVLVGLDQQEGPAEVVFAGDSGGLTVATRHDVREGDRVKSYLLIVGGLGRIEAGVAAGAKLESGAPLGAASPSVGGRLVEITFAVRQVREGAKAEALDAKKLGDEALAIPIDVRNVLPLR